MSSNTMLPLLTRPWTDDAHDVIPVRFVPGLKRAPLKSLRASFPGHLTPEFERLLTMTAGLEGTALQYLDFTGQWHDEEPVAVFRPCLSLAVDRQNRRWIAETSRTSGLPGPVWCVSPDPQIVLYVSRDLGEFLELLRQMTREGSVDHWLKSLDARADRAWSQRGALAFQARQDVGHDRHVREWLFQLPRDARVYDLRAPTLGTAWPYGAAGSAGRLHRCGRELIFAVSGFPAPSRWSDYLGSLAHHHRAPAPAVVTRGLTAPPPR